MLKIRLSRTGKKSQPSFRIVVQEHTSPIKGKFIETLGHYLPSVNPKEFKADLERVKYWISVGAQPSDTVAGLLKNYGLEGMEKFMEPRNKKRKKKKEVAEAPAAAAPAAPAPAAAAPAAAAPAPAEEAAAPAEEAPAPAEEAPAPAEEAPAPAEEAPAAEAEAPAEEAPKSE